jgi:predicted Zn-dependent protease
MRDEDDARKLCDEILALSKADEASVSIGGGRRANLRFARSSPSTSGERDDLSITVTSVFGRRSGSATVNQRDRATLEAAVRRSEELARLAPEDPEHMPALGPQTYPAVPHGFDADTAEHGAEAMPAGVATCLREAIDRGLVAAGYASTSAETDAIATSRGLFGFHRSTSASLSETVRTADARGSGWAGSASPRAAAVDYAGVSRTAIAKALASAEPRPLEPGSFVTVLEPSCVAELLRLFAFALDARSSDEGRSYFAKPGGGTRVGEKLFGDDVDVTSDPLHADVPGMPWGGDRVPQARVEWVKGGVLQTLRHDRYWADKKGVAPVPAPVNLIMSGGTGTVDDLIASTERGVLVTSFWYIRSLDPRSLLFTGLTRDGVFWIEKGKIAHPVTNFRWNDSPIAVLKNIVGRSAAAPAVPRGAESLTSVVPALKVSAFNLASVSEAV